MYIIDRECVFELGVKKSKFIAQSFIVDSENAVKERLNIIAESHRGATHNCYAYRIKTENSVNERRCDDGEPGGTAGGPILAVLSGEAFVNTLVVVTRYFGGVKLGTGGLVSAYKKSTSEVLKLSGKIQFEVIPVYSIKLSINKSDDLIRILNRENIRILSKEFHDEVVVRASFNKKQISVIDMLRERFNCVCEIE